MRCLALAAVVVGVFLISCDKDDPGPQDLVTYTLELNTRAWLFASGPDGKVLDFKKLEFDSAVSLNAANPPDSFSITLVLIAREHPLYVVATTYTGITPGSVFTPRLFNPGAPEQIEKDGKVTVKVTNYPTEQKLPLIVADQYQSTTYNSDGTTTPTFVMNVWKSKASHFLLTGYNGDMLHPVYTHVDTEGAEATAFADFNTFTPFEKTIEIKGFDSDQRTRLGFTMYSLVSDYVPGTQLAEIGWQYAGKSPVARVGYLDEFDNYYIDLRFYELSRQQGFSRFHQFTQKGPITRPIDILDDKFSISNESMSSPVFTFSGKPDVMMHVYEYLSSTITIVWSVYAGPGAQTPVKQIPNELLSVYPDMDPNSIPYRGSSFYKYYDGYNYHKFVQEAFIVSYGPLHPGYEQTFSK